MKNTLSGQADNSMIAPIGEDQSETPSANGDPKDRYQPPRSALTKLDWIKFYRSIGWVPIPIHDVSTGSCSCRLNLGCTSLGKHPRVTREAAKQANEETWRSWLADWPNMNIGILTGAESGIFVIDIDPRHGGDDSIQELVTKFGKLPRTLTASTGGGGRHFVYQIPSTETVKSSANVIANGVDVRGEGGIIVVEPSKTSGDYKWL
jgi:hypothetical protein